MWKNKIKEPRYWIALPAIIAAYLILKSKGQNPTLLILHLVLLTTVYAAAVEDLIEKKISNLLVIAMAAAWLLVLAPLFFCNLDLAVSIGLRGIFGLVVSGVIMFTVYLLSRKGMGGGDVKLMSVAGLYLGLDGALTALLYGSVLLALTALVLIIAKKIKVKDTLPMVPFLYIGILATEFIR